MLSGAFQQNNHKRTQGQLGMICLTAHYEISFARCYAEIQWLAAMSSYMSRTTSSNAVTINPDDIHNQIMFM
jgi:hypothetical protein